MAAMDTTLDSALPCIDCGYDLRGIEASNNCPECGAAVERSMRGDRLSFANPRWLGKVKWGVGLVGVGFGLDTLTTFIDDLLGIPYWESEIGRVAYVLEYWLCTGSFLIGLWLITFPEPRVTNVWMQRQVRHAARFVVALIALVVCLFEILYVVLAASFILGLLEIIIYQVLQMFSMLGLIVLVFHVSPRIPARGLRVICFIPICLVMARTITVISHEVLITRDLSDWGFSLFLILWPMDFWVTGPALSAFCVAAFFLLHHQHRLARQLALSHA